MLASIRARLTFSHLAVILLAMSLSGYLLLSSLEHYFLEAMEDSLAAQAQITAQALIPGAQAAGLPAVAQNSAYNTLQQQQASSNLSLQTQNLALPGTEGTTPSIDLTTLADASLQLSSQLDTRIRILDTTGLVLLDTAQTDRGVDRRADPLVAEALAGRSASRTDKGDTSYYATPAMHLAMPVVAEGQVVGLVYLSQPLRDLTAVLHELRARWLLSTGIALILSAAVGLLLSGAIARPLHRLTVAAGAVAQGQLDQALPARSSDELGRLSRAFNDMTARLKAARQQQVDLVANVSHELRTPLTAIKGLVETLRQGAVDDPEVRDRFLETVESETDRLIRLVRDLLLLSRADSEALGLEREPVDLAQLARVTASRLAPQAEARGLTLRMETGPACPPAEADADRIEQVLVNLVDNALKYSRPGGDVVVRVSAGPDRTAQVQVQDEGIGISPEHLERIGQRFYRADTARSRAEDRSAGSGLGLAIARALVEAHGGRLWVESREGQGTVVTFTLPSIPDH